MQTNKELPYKINQAGQAQRKCNRKQKTKTNDKYNDQQNCHDFQNLIFFKKAVKL